MAFAFNPFTGNFDLKGSGGGSAFFAGEVATYADLPLDGTAALNSRWLVRNSSGTWPFPNYRQGGIYIRTSIVGSSRDNDYTLADTKLPDVFADSAFLLYDNSDSTRNLQFDLGSITTGTVRTLTAPDASGRIQVEGQPIGNTTPAAGTFTTLTANNGTLTASAPVLDLSQTWANGAVAFTGFRINVTNAASQANTSSYAEFQTAGVMRYSFSETGRFSVNAASGAEPNFRAKITTDTVYRFQVGLASNNEAQIEMGAGGGSARDTFLNRDAAGVFAQRNAANPQTFNIYNTHSSSTNHERGFLKWSSNVFQIGTEKGSGGGTARALEIRTDNVARINIGAAGQIGFFGAAAAAQPAAVADATDAASTQARLNDLLARLRTLGLIAT